MGKIIFCSVLFFISSFAIGQSEGQQNENYAIPNNSDLEIINGIAQLKKKPYLLNTAITGDNENTRYNDMAVKGNYAYLVDAFGLTILNISDAGNPEIVGLIRAERGIIFLASPQRIAIKGNNNQDSVMYQLTSNGGDTREYWNGSNWVITTAANGTETNTSTDVNGNTYAITITATDDNNSNNVATKNWSLTVEDIEENVDLNITNISNTATTIKENKLYTGPAPTVSNAIGDLTYTISGGADNNMFIIDEETGIVTMLPKDFENKLDADENGVYEIEITAADSDGNTATKTWAVEVANVDEMRNLIFTSQEWGGAFNPTPRVEENSPYRGLRMYLEHPHHSTRTGKLIYSISGADAGHFEVDPTTGVVTMEAKNFEDSEDVGGDNKYNITLTVRDEDINFNLRHLLVEIPNIDNEFTITIPEDNIQEGVRYSSTATVNTQETVTYSITGGADRDKFELDVATGELTMESKDFERPVDRDRNNTYEVELTATDSDNNTATMSWSVEVTDVTETASFTINMIGNAEVNDNLTTRIQTPFPNANTPHAIPGVIIATNFDTGGEGVAYHDIDTGNSGTGLRQNENVDTENEDGGQPNIGWGKDGEWQEYTVNVIQSGDYSAVVRVASVLPTPGSFRIDIDGINVAGTVNAITTGSWSNFQEVTINNISLTAGQHILRFNTVVGGFNWSKITFTKVGALNVISGGNAEVNENSSYEVTLEFTGDEPIGTVTYTLEGADKDLFSIDEATGVVTMQAKDFENPEDANNNNAYEIGITATDSDNNTATTNWSVEVKDVVGFSIIPISNATIDENTST